MYNRILKRNYLFILLILFSGIFALTGLSSTIRAKEVKEMGNEGLKKALMVIAHQDFRDEEFLDPKSIFEKNGLQVVVASSSLAIARGVLGAQYKPDIPLADVQVDDYSIIVFVGGAGSKEYWKSEKAHDIARKAVSQGKVLGAICIAPVILANAGLLNGKNATVFPSEANVLISKGAHYTGKEVEKDGLIITASGPTAAKKFGSALIDALSAQSNP